MTSFKKKLKTLRSILAKYAKYFKYPCEIKCYIEHSYIVIYLSEKNAKWHNHKIKIPSKNIDETIKHYRDKLNYKELKLSENKEIKGLDEAILEDDIMNLRETLNDIIN